MRARSSPADSGRSPMLIKAIPISRIKPATDQHAHRRFGPTMILRLRFLLDLVRVFWILPQVEQQRNRLSLHAAVAAARRRAARLRARTPEQRQWWRRAIIAIDS